MGRTRVQRVERAYLTGILNAEEACEALAKVVAEGLGDDQERARARELATKLETAVEPAV